MTSFLESEEWHAAVAKPQQSRPPLTIERAAVTELLHVIATQAGAPRVAAFGMLRAINRRPELFPLSGWDAPAASQFAGEVRRWAEQYFTGDLPSSDHAFGPVRFSWMELCLADCVSFLLALDIEALSSPLASVMLRTLSGSARLDPRALEYMRQIVATSGPLAHDAQMELEEVGFVSTERLEHFSTRWRLQRDPAALDWLYAHWIEFLPVGYSKAEILRVLGPPTDGSPPDVYWSAGGGGHVYLELYESGLSGCHRT